MSLYRRLFAPPNALILQYDDFTDEDAQALDARLDEIRKYYRFAKLSQIAEALESGKALGLASVVFRHARKSLFLRALPILRGHDVPITVFLRPDCIGLNRLPSEEELALFAQGYPEGLNEAEVSRRLQEGWTDPEGLDRFLMESRQRLGPLPLEGFDPMLFLATWGKVLEVAPDRIDIGINFGSDPSHRASLEQIQFLKNQTGRTPSVACGSRSLEGYEAVLKRLGIRAVLGAREGAVEKSTPLFDLPVWRYVDPV